MGSELKEPSFQDVLRAKPIVDRYLSPTPLIRPAALSKLIGCEAFLKLENLQPTGSFKLRGGVNLMSQLTEEERRAGVITASTGNHALSIAFSGRLFGLRPRIVLSHGANPYKIEAIRELGGDVVFHGEDFDDAREYAEKLAQEQGCRYVHTANEPLLIAGVATEWLEVVQAVPDIDVMIAPVGGGTGACGACIVAKCISQGIRVIGVQAENAPAVYLSWRNERLMETDSCETIADGLATRVAFELPYRILRKYLDDFVLVSEDELRFSTRFVVQQIHQVVEPAGAASVAAALKLKNELKEKKVATVLSGGNIATTVLGEILTGESS